MPFIQNIIVSLARSPAMNSMSVSADLVEDADNNDGSDSDTNSDDEAEYYQPIPPDEEEDSNSNSETDRFNSDEDRHGSNTSVHGLGNLPNGYFEHLGENGFSSLHLNDNAEEAKSNSSDDENEGERMRAASVSAMLRAFRENESRRSAPLTPENATRVREAMREVSFGGVAPDWARAVPDDQWFHQLRRLRQSGGTSSSRVQTGI